MRGNIGRRRTLGLSDYVGIALSMFALLSVAFSMSNRREIQVLWQMQRHALVHYYGFRVT